MPDIPTPRHLVLGIGANGGDDRLDAVLKALASEPRRRILVLLGDALHNVSEIAAALDLPVSTANMHVGVLERAGLLITDHRPAARGSQKVCTRAFDSVTLRMPTPTPEQGSMLELAVPIGSYVDCQVSPSCGLASAEGIIGLFDDPASFYDPVRTDAQLLWFHHGHVEYRVAHRLPPTAVLQSVHVSAEVCSEAPLHHDDWPSDITLWLNGIEVGSWTSPADFGGQRGTLTPGWWEDHNSQYGLLKVWQVNGEGSWVDGIRVSDVRLTALRIPDRPYLTVRLGVKPRARHVGGLNLFGRRFGNYPQDLVVRLKYA
jgi:predicted transcriptional regulator